MALTENQILEMINQIPDLAVREQYRQALTQVAVEEVYCITTGKEKKDGSRAVGDPVKIGEKLSSGQWVSTTPGDATHHMLSHRHRTDGQVGFFCTCGNRSILAPEEKGVIGSNSPSRKDLQEIFTKIQARKSDPAKQLLGGGVECDGFQIRPVTALVGV